MPLRWAEGERSAMVSWDAHRSGNPVRGAAITGGRATVLEELTKLIGAPATQQMIAAFGGARLYVPRLPEPDDPLAQVLGLEAALALARVYGGDRLEVPNPPSRKARILELRQAGLSVDNIARQLGCTRRRVFQILAEARAAATRPGGEVASGGPAGRRSAKGHAL